MLPSNIIIGKHYRLRHSKEYGHVKALEVLKPKTRENTKSYIVVKCEHTVYKNSNFGLIRYFRPVDLIQEVTK
jgi:hypothetical protein